MCRLVVLAGSKPEQGTACRVSEFQWHIYGFRDLPGSTVHSFRDLPGCSNWESASIWELPSARFVCSLWLSTMPMCMHTGYAAGTPSRLPADETKRLQKVCLRPAAHQDHSEAMTIDHQNHFDDGS